jgi:hypothetical protein
MTKIFGYNYEIIYKKLKENVVANDISRKYEEEGSLFSLSFIVVYWLKLVHHEWFQDPKISSSIQELQQDNNSYQGYTWKNEELRYKGFLYLTKQSKFKSMLLSELHASPTRQHPRFHKTYEQINCSFLWEGMKQYIHTFVEECDTFEPNKGETVKNQSTLQPLPIPLSIWAYISMEFIIRLTQGSLTNF